MKKHRIILKIALLAGLSTTVLASCNTTAAAEKTNPNLPEKIKTEINPGVQSKNPQNQELSETSKEPVQKAPLKAEEISTQALPKTAADLDIQQPSEKVATKISPDQGEISKVVSETVETGEVVQTLEKSTLPVVDNEEIKPEETVALKAFSHDAFNTLLGQYVTSSGKVNYAGFKGNASFKTYLSELSANSPESSWSKNKKLAYWINAYNAFTIQLIIDNYPLKSITDLSGGKPWDKKFITIGAKSYSLNDIEHGIIRKQFNEPRIHFACVCAAKSCPKLLNQAYTEAKLNSQLTAQTKYFINDASRNQIADKNLKVSKLFEWYAGDFGDVNAYIAKYYNGTFKPDSDIEFMEYDWSLNN